MANRKDRLLENEINRFNSIIAYQDKLNINESSYRFYNEADDIPTDEEEPKNPDNLTDDGTMPPAEDNTQGGQENNPEMGGDMDSVPTDNMDDMSMGGGGGGSAPSDPAGEMGGGPGLPDDTNQSAENMPPMDGMNGGEEEEVTEIDITDLVNDTKDIMTKTTDALLKIDAVISKVGNIEANLQNMDTLISKMEDVARQVELMRPPTEAERRKALSKDSYPFNIPIDQYKNGEGEKTQTELENNSKMSMLNTIMGDYNDSTVRDSFNVPKDNFFVNR